MRYSLAIVLILVTLPGCDDVGNNSGVTVEAGRFTSSVPGVVDGPLVGEATFTTGTCGNSITLESDAGTIMVERTCYRQRDAIREGRFNIRLATSAGAYQARFVRTSSDTLHMAVGGSVEITEVGRGRVAGRLSLQTKPEVGGRDVPNLVLVPITGEFDAVAAPGGSD